MKQIVFIILFLTTFTVSFGQKFGYIDSEYILSKMPEYKKAQSELEKLSQQWQKEMEDMKAQIEKLQSEYKAEEVLLTEEMKKERQDTIFAREKALRDYQKKMFGFEGMLFLKRQELMKPVQDKVFGAVEKVSKAKNIQIMFDKAGELIMVYTNPIHDYTDYVLEELGLGDKKDMVDSEK
ncbi:MAG TPA: OmpH family outer membrane protein [Cytophagaceae bacterium]